ncbi:hypothetical protein [Leifsonia xyli]|uniref:hypothetical protein n=1 Tax=Leifsonia xyli TaxID=1575 RepID=UPI003D673A31
MDLLINLLGLLGLICIALLGIAASGYLTARRMREAQEPEPSTDPTERNQES